MTSVLAAELREPHVGALGDEYGVGHPCRIGRKLFVLVGRVAKDRHLGMAVGKGALVPVAPRALGCIRVGRVELRPNGEFFLAEDCGRQFKEALQAVANERLPKFLYEGKLIAEGVR